MARARVKKTRQQTEIAEVIIAEWFRVLPETGTATLPLNFDKNALKAAFSEILEQQVSVEVDPSDSVVIVVPHPPRLNRTDLRDYLAKNEDFRQGMSAAVLFGCGR